MGKMAQQAMLLKELALDADWTAAGRRAGLSSAQVTAHTLDDRFMTKVEKLVNKQLEAHGAVDKAMDKFMRTQHVLMTALEGGELGVANSLMKSHDIEFRLNGLFEKDNNQKRNPVMINIDLSGTNEGVTVNGT